MKRRMLSIICALALCLTLLPTAALADGLETGTPTLLNGEGETDYATPSEEDGWTQLSDGTWFLVAEKTYDQPLRSENPIQIDSNAILTAPSITVDGMVDVSGSAYLICSGELSAKELQVSSSVTVGTFSCSKVNVSGGGKLTVTTKWNCSGKVTVDKNSTLNLPAGTEPDWGNFSGAGTVQIGGMAYDTAGNEQGTAMLMLTSGASASGQGYTWDRDTCTLTLDGFARTYDTEAEGGIGIQAEGRAITLVLKGENVMNGLDAAGITCVGSSLTLKGAGSLDCEGSAGALMIYGGSLALAEGYSLNEEAEIFNETSGAGGMVIEAGTDETGPIPATSFTIQSEQSEGDIAIDETNFPDETFRNYVKDNFDDDNDGYLSQEEGEAVTSIDVQKKSITGLQGIEYFPNLTTLNCYNNQLTSLDVSQNTALEQLNCNNQAPEKEVLRTNGSWRLNLSTLFDDWNKVSEIQVQNATLDEDGKTVTWSDGGAVPVVTYYYDVGYSDQKMNVTLSLKGVISVTGVTLDPTSLSLFTGDTATLTATVEPDNATNKNVTWTSSNTAVATVNDGVVTAVSAGTATITVTTSDGGFTALCTVTVQKQSSSSSGGSSGGGSSSTTTETTKNPDGSTTTTVTNKVTGTVTETTKFPDGSKEVVETKKDGTVTTTTTTDTTGNKTQVVENTDGTKETTITNKDGSSSATTVDETGKTQAEVKLPAAVVEDAQGEAVTLPMPEVPITTDRETAPTVTVDLPSGTSAKVEIPVAEVTPGTVAVIVKADGTEEVIKTSLTTENGVAVTLSDGDTVKIVNNSKSFDDVSATYWGAEAVDFTSSRELFAGTSATTFAPDTAMTRAMIVTVLARFEGVDTTTGDTWYEAGQQWAMQNGVSDGSNMDASLTREQLVTMFYRYAQSKGYDTTQGGMAIREYADFEQISDYAVEAMTWAVNTGIINGTSSTTLSPQGPATRAQVATILMRFIEGMA